MLIDTSRRRSPSTANFATWERSEATSASVRSFTLTLYFTPAASHMRAARLLPMPKMWVKPTTTCLFIGMLMPAIRAIYFSPLRTTIAHAKKRASIDKKRSNIKFVATRHGAGAHRGAARAIVNKPDLRIAALALALFVPRIGRANDVDDAATPHDLAVFTDLLHRVTDFHFLLPMPRKLAFFIRPSYWCDIKCDCVCATKSITPTTMINNEVPPN